MKTTEAIKALETLIAKAAMLNDRGSWEGEKYDQAYIDSKISESAPAWNGVNADAWLKEVRGQDGTDKKDESTISERDAITITEMSVVCLGEGIGPDDHELLAKIADQHPNLPNKYPYLNWPKNQTQ